jgi:hypothetical protein
MDSLPESVNVHDAGDRIILAGPEEALMNEIAQTLEKEGARDVKRPVSIGGKWIMSFRNPASSTCMVEKLGYRTLLSASSRDVVVTTAQQMVMRGSTLVDGPLQRDGLWRIVLEG